MCNHILVKVIIKPSHFQGWYPFDPITILGTYNQHPGTLNKVNPPVSSMIICKFDNI